MLKDESFEYQKKIALELKRRKAFNPRYSLRAFARDLSVSSTTLSDVLQCKRDLSKGNALRIAERLNWTPYERESLMGTILHRSKTRAASLKGSSETLRLAEQEFDLIASWTMIATLNLASIKANQAKPAWIAKQLGIGIDRAEHALRVLRGLGYVEVRKGKILRKAKKLEANSSIPSAALARFHKSLLELAHRAIEQVPREERDITASAIAIDRSKIEEAKKIVKKFRAQMTKLLKGSKSEEVYFLSVQLFPARENSK